MDISEKLVTLGTEDKQSTKTHHLHNEKRGKIK